MKNNETIKKERAEKFAVHTKPQVGDYLVFGYHDKRRITQVWGSDEHGYAYQTGSIGGSYHLGDGYTSFSGGLDPAIPGEQIIDTGEREDARFWFFSEGIAGAGRGVDVTIPVRVWKLRGAFLDPEHAYNKAYEELCDYAQIKSDDLYGIPRSMKPYKARDRYQVQIALKPDELVPAPKSLLIQVKVDKYVTNKYDRRVWLTLPYPFEQGY